MKGSFKIVRNDITRMYTDAIVNTANENPAVGAGCDTAVYEAAGYDELLQYRKEKIGFVPEGQAFITPGFHLKARYIIHAVSPLYVDGSEGEKEKLRSCYRNSLRLAKEYRLSSIAFPLISTGSFGYPREEGMRIALDEIKAFLRDYNMLVYLVVFDEKSTVHGRKIYPDLEEYIDRHYVDDAFRIEYEKDERPNYSSSATIPRPARPYSDAKLSQERPVNLPRPSAAPSAPKAKKRRSLHLKDIIFGRKKPQEPERTESSEEYTTGFLSSGSFAEESPDYTASSAPYADGAGYQEDAGYPGDGGYQGAAGYQEAAGYHGTAGYLEDTGYLDFDGIHGSRLEKRMQHLSDTFSQYLLYLIEDKNMGYPEVYKRAIVDKKIFSKIKNDKDYHPKKLTALCLCVGAKLNLDESKDLLARAGYALSPCDKTDIIFSYFIENKIYDMIELDIQLEEHGLPCIIT